MDEKGELVMTFETTIYELLKYLNCIFEVFLFYYFLESLFPMYEDRKLVRAIDMTMIASVLYAVNGLEIPAFNLTMAFFGFACLAWLIFHKSLRAILPYSMLCVIILASLEVVFVYVYHLIGVDRQEPDMRRIMMLLLQGVIRFFIVVMLRKNNSDVWNHGQAVNGYLKYLYVLPAATVILLNGILYFREFPWGYILISVGGIFLILSNIVEFFIIEKIMEVMDNMRGVENALLKSRLERWHFERIEALNQEYAIYAHEIRKMARTVEQLAEQGNQEEICKIAKHLQENNNWVSSKVYCVDKIINAVLLERKKMAEEQKIQFDAEVQVGIDFGFIEETDRIVLLGNLLDNAVEGATKATDGYVRVDIYMGNNALLIMRIENNHNTKLKKKGSEYMTIKQEKGHGYGLKNVRACVEKYGGNLFLEEQDGTFLAILIVSNVKKKDN